MGVDRSSSRISRACPNCWRPSRIKEVKRKCFLPRSAQKIVNVLLSLIVSLFLRSMIHCPTMHIRRREKGSFVNASFRPWRCLDHVFSPENEKPRGFKRSVRKMVCSKDKSGLVSSEPIGQYSRIRRKCQAAPKRL